jgi:hypothetical protein
MCFVDIVLQERQIGLIELQMRIPFRLPVQLPETPQGRPSIAAVSDKVFGQGG